MTREAWAIGRAAVHATATFLELNQPNLGIHFQEIAQQNEEGIDAMVQVPSSGSDEGFSFSLQIKGGKTYKAKTGHKIEMTARWRKLWRNSRPIYVIVQDPDDKELYWGNLARMADIAPTGWVRIYPDVRLTPDGLHGFLKSARTEALCPRPPYNPGGGRPPIFARYCDGTIGLSREALEAQARLQIDNSDDDRRDRRHMGSRRLYFQDLTLTHAMADEEIRQGMHVKHVCGREPRSYV